MRFRCSGSTPPFVFHYFLHHPFAFLRLLVISRLYLANLFTQSHLPVFLRDTYFVLSRSVPIYFALTLFALRLTLHISLIWEGAKAPLRSCACHARENSLMYTHKKFPHCGRAGIFAKISSRAPINVIDNVGAGALYTCTLRRVFNAPVSSTPSYVAFNQILPQ